MLKRIAILGSTGSIGVQTLEVIEEHKGLLSAYLLSGHSNSTLLIQQALKHLPAVVVVTQNKAYHAVKDALAGTGIAVYGGENALIDAMTLPEIDIVLGAIVGFAGLMPVLAAIEAGKTIALANKETLVVAGEWVMQQAAKHSVAILPVDSEHSAIYQCLVGEQSEAVEKVILTASGGTFLGKKRADLAHITAAEALKHPNWSMGKKITVDSSSLMNKGLEMIEAKWLFGLNNEQIDVVVHPQSIIHSMVQFTDGSVKAQLGLPDMKLPIQYALAYPQRLPNTFKRIDFATQGMLTFQQPDYTTFENLALAKKAMITGGNAPCALNAANEIAVEAFLEDKINFLDMPRAIAHVLDKIPHIAHPSIDDYRHTDTEARRIAQEYITQ